MYWYVGTFISSMQFQTNFRSLFELDIYKWHIRKKN